MKERGYYFQIGLLEFSFKKWLPHQKSKGSLYYVTPDFEEGKGLMEVRRVDGTTYLLSILRFMILINTDEYSQASEDEERFSWLAALSPRRLCIAHEILIASRIAANLYGPSNGVAIPPNHLPFYVKRGIPPHQTNVWLKDPKALRLELSRRVYSPDPADEIDLLCSWETIERLLLTTEGTFGGHVSTVDEYREKSGTNFIKLYYRFWSCKCVDGVIASTRTKEYLRMVHRRACREKAIANLLSIQSTYGLSVTAHTQIETMHRRKDPAFLEFIRRMEADGFLGFESDWHELIAIRAFQDLRSQGRIDD